MASTVSRNWSRAFINAKPKVRDIKVDALTALGVATFAQFRFANNQVGLRRRLISNTFSSVTGIADKKKAAVVVVEAAAGGRGHLRHQLHVPGR